MRGEHDYFRDERAEHNRIAYRELRISVEENLIQPDADWLTTEQATQLLSVSADGLFQRQARESIRSKSRSRKVSNAQGVGLLWYRPDIDRVNQLRHECRIGLTTALRVLAAEKENRI